MIVITLVLCVAIIAIVYSNIFFEHFDSLIKMLDILTAYPLLKTFLRTLCVVSTTLLQEWLPVHLILKLHVVQIYQINVAMINERDKLISSLTYSELIKSK
jgi:hypothetical protein